MAGRRGCPKGPVKDERRIYVVKVSFNRKEKEWLDGAKEVTGLESPDLLRQALKYYHEKLVTSGK